MEKDRRRSEEECAWDEVLDDAGGLGISLTDDDEEQPERGKAAAPCSEAEEQRTMLESRRPGMVATCQTGIEQRQVRVMVGCSRGIGQDVSHG